MTRDEAAAWLGQRLAQYLVAVNRAATDTPGDLKEVIDDALRAVGTAYVDIPSAVVDGDAAVDDYALQLTYRGLLQINRDLGATHFNVATGGDSYQLAQIRAAAEKDLADVKLSVQLIFGPSGVAAGDTSAASDWLVILDTNMLVDDGGAIFDPYASITP